MTDKIFGQTVLVDVFKADESLLSSEDVFRLLLIRSVEAVKMTPVINTLHVVKFPVPLRGQLRGGYGLSGGMILVESHIYGHTWPENNYGHWEISSCKEIDMEVPRLTDVFFTIFGRDSLIFTQVVNWRVSYGEDQER